MKDIETPEEKARNDFYHGGNQSTNTYPASSDPNSDYQRYAWEMHRMVSKSFTTLTKDVVRRKEV